MLGREKIHEADSFGEIARDEYRATVRERAAREIRRGQLRELRGRFRRRPLCPRRAEVVTKIEIASGSCSAWAIRSAAMNWGLPSIGEDDGFGGAGEHVDGAVGADEALGGGDEAIAGAKDFIDARNRSRAVSKSGDGLRAANAGDRAHAKPFGSGEQRGSRLRADDDDLAHASFLRGDDGHEQGRDEREATAGKIAADGFDGAHALPGADARLDFDVPFERFLLLSHGANVARRHDQWRREMPRALRAKPA